MYRDIYFDNSATTKPYEKVLDIMREVGGNCYGNPSSLHSRGIEAERLINGARDTVAGCMGAESKEIIFTSGGTESNNLAIRGYLEANSRKGGHIITTAIEHPSVLEVFRYLETKGLRVDYLEVGQDGKIILEQLEEKICDDTALISIMLVNNETGTIQPVNEVAVIRDRKNRNTVIHADAVQAFGKFMLNPAKSGIDLMSLSSHKINGPKGVGALYSSKRLKIKPLILGGGQEGLLRSGTENVPGICGFGLSAELSLKSLDGNHGIVTSLNSYLRRKLSGCSFDYCILSPASASPYILNISFPGLKSEVLLHHLEQKGIFVSTGSACSSRKNKKSHVLTAMGIDNRTADGAVRFSFSGFNTETEIDEMTDALETIIPVITIKSKGRLGAK